MKKVYFTLGAIVRDQEHYIQEWILFHHAVGVERFVIVLHQCSDRTEEKILRVQKEFGYDIHIHHSDDSGKVQMGVYRWIARNYGAATEWLLFLDSDEFLFGDKVFDVKEILAGFERFGGLSVQQAVFGPDGNIVRPWIPQIDAYKHRLKFEHPLSKGIKTIFQPRKLIDLLSPHIQQVRDGNVRADEKPFTLVDYWRSEEIPIHWPIRFNHYYTRSMQDWVQRCKRGSCNDAKTGNAYSVDEFMYITDQATEFDYAALRIMGQYQREIGLLRDSDKSTFSERINERGMNNAIS